MKNFFRGKIVTGVVIIATIILAGVAIFTALRLYNLRKEGITPTAPESKPKATASEETKSCQLLAFNIVSPTQNPTTSPTATTTLTPTSTPSVTPSPTDVPRGGTSPTPTEKPISTPTPTGVSSPTPTSGKIAVISPTPGGAALPDAGTSFPTLIAIASGFLIILIAFILAL